VVGIPSGMVGFQSAKVGFWSAARVFRLAAAGYRGFIGNLQAFAAGRRATAAGILSVLIRHVVPALGSRAIAHGFDTTKRRRRMPETRRSLATSGRQSFVAQRRRRSAMLSEAAYGDASYELLHLTVTRRGMSTQSVVRSFSRSRRTFSRGLRASTARGSTSLPSFRFPPPALGFG
jgi:hypothetical protein